MVDRLASLRKSQLQEFVRVLDDALNNTSVILLFEVGAQKLLFPGDAQIESWLYALNLAPDAHENRERLKDVTLYKVGHHGSLNATPRKSLWNLMENRTDPATERDDRPLTTVLSTLKGKHGSEAKKTEVPRRTLVESMVAETRFFTTEEVKASDLYEEILIPL